MEGRKREKARTASRDIGRMQGPLSPPPLPPKKQEAPVRRLTYIVCTVHVGGNLDTAAKHDLHDRTSTTQLRFHESCHVPLPVGGTSVLYILYVCTRSLP